MVTITFFGLIRSNHNLKTLKFEPQSLRSIITTILEKHKTLTFKEIEDAVLFINNEKIMHLNRFEIMLNDGDDVKFTNFVGGG